MELLQRVELMGSPAALPSRTPIERTDGGGVNADVRMCLSSVSPFARGGGTNDDERRDVAFGELLALSDALSLVMVALVAVPGGGVYEDDLRDKGPGELVMPSELISLVIVLVAIRGGGAQDPDLIDDGLDEEARRNESGRLPAVAELSVCERTLQANDLVAEGFGVFGMGSELTSLNFEGCASSEFRLH